jgi:hypothetical protein
LSSRGSLKKQLKINKPLNSKARADISTRVEHLEQATEQLYKGFQKFVDSVNSRFEDIGRSLNAIATLVGRDSVSKTMTEQHIEELEKESAALESNIKAALTEGRLKAVDTAEAEEYIVVISQRDADGNSKHPLKVHVPLGGYTEEAKKLLLGKKVGDIVTLESDKSTIEVLAVYRPLTEEERQAFDAKNEADQGEVPSEAVTTNEAVATTEG